MGNEHAHKLLKKKKNQQPSTTAFRGEEEKNKQLEPKVS